MKAFSVLGFVVVIATIFNCEAEAFPSNSSDIDGETQNYGETDDMDLLGFGNGGGGSGGGGGGGEGGEGGGGSEDSGSKASPDAQAEAIRKITLFRAKYAQAAVTLNPDLATLAQTCANNLRQQDVDATDEALDDNRLDSDFLCDHELEAMQFFCLGPPGVDDEIFVVSSCIDRWTSLEAVGYPFGPDQRYDVTRRHFTQIIWDSLKTVAIGVSTRRTATANSKVFVAILDPAGNVRNGESQRPFLHHIKAPIRLSAVDEEEVPIDLK